jgi:hypothetical protein
LYNALRIETDPTYWELTEAVEQVPTSSDPVVLPVSHPLLGDLVLSPRSVSSAVFFERIDIYGTRPNGMPIGGPVLYVPSPLGPDVHRNPTNFYPLASSVDRVALQAEIIAAMAGGTFLTVNIDRGTVVINGAAVPFVVLCPRHI